MRFFGGGTAASAFLRVAVWASLPALALTAREPAVAPPQTLPVALRAVAGVPLRLYLTKRLRMRDGAPVEAKLLEPLYAFDRQVAPEGTVVTGRVHGFLPAAGIVRARAILGGDFTPLHEALVEFTGMRLPDGRLLTIRTQPSAGLPSIALLNRVSQPPTEEPATRFGQMKAAIRAKTRDISDLVRGPNKIKMEMFEDFLIGRLPYHPQWYRTATRFDAVLAAPVDFGTAEISVESLRSMGMQPPSESTVHIRLVTPLSSARARHGQAVEGVVSQPLFDGGQLVLPEGTRVEGTVRQAQPARWFHRGGRLRFTFDSLETPQVAALVPAIGAHVDGLLARAESDPAAGIRIDGEGTAKATESKKRFLEPVFALWAAGRAMDSDPVSRQGLVAGSNKSNYAGRALGGFSGFGFLGAAIGVTSKTAGITLGFYGFAASMYWTVISRGNEVEFSRNTPLEVRFGERAAPSRKLDTAVEAGKSR